MKELLLILFSILSLVLFGLFVVFFGAGIIDATHVGSDCHYRPKRIESVIPFYRWGCYLGERPE